MEGSPPDEPDDMTSPPAAELFAAFSVLETPGLKRRISQAMEEGKSERDAVAPSSRGGAGAYGGEPRLCRDGGGAFGRSAHPVWTGPGC
jgi:hypothetical protein